MAINHEEVEKGLEIQKERILAKQRRSRKRLERLEDLDLDLDLDLIFKDKATSLWMIELGEKK